MTTCVSCGYEIDMLKDGYSCEGTTNYRHLPECPLKPPKPKPVSVSELQRVRDSLAAYVEAEHTRIHPDNDEPGYTVRVWTSDWYNGRKALEMLDNYIGTMT